MKTSTKLLSMFSAFCALFLWGMTANAQSITVTPGLTATQMAQALVGSNVTVTNATYTGATTASGSFSQASSAFPLTDGIILTSGNVNNALGPNNSTGASATNNTAGDAALLALTGGITTFDAAVLEFDITSNCNTVTFDYIFASEEYLEYGCSNFNDAFAFFITGPGYTPNTNIALVPGTSVPVSINNVINDPANNCVSNPTYYVDNAGGVAMQYDGSTVVMTATATIQPCQTYHIKIVVADAGDSALDSAIFLKGGGINCTSPGIATSANITPVECAGLGAIDLSVNSGTGPFTFSWTGPNGFTATTEDISGLQAGNYTVDIVGSDCLSSGQETFTVPDNADVTPPVFTDCPSDLIIDAASNLCDFSVDVLANVTVTDNCSVASITTSHDTTYQFGAGTTPVTVTATDPSGNQSTCTFNVIVNAQPLEVTLTPFQYNGGVNIRCYGQNTGRVTACATGGCAPYTYTWSAGAAFPAPAPPGCNTQWQLFAGAVTCTVTDAAGNSVTEVVTLTQNPPVTATATWAPIPCFGGTTTVNLNVQGGTPNGQGGYNGVTQYNNVGPGTYEYVVADGNGCRAYDTINITQPALLEASATPTQILCFGDTSYVTVSATGGTGPLTGVGTFPELAGTHTYNVVDANGCSDQVVLTITQPGQLTALVSNTPILCYGDSTLITVSVLSGTEPWTGTGQFWEPAGTYTYTVYDYNLCEDEVTITVTQPTQMVATATATPILCTGDSSTIVVTGQGGTGAWTGTGTFVEPAGTYGYGFTDANGCIDSISVTVSEPSQLVVSATATSILCNGGTADVTVTATGGTPPYTGDGVYNVTAGTYTYTVTDANGCSETVSVTVTEPTALSVSATATSIDCNGGTADVTITATGGTAPYTGDGVYNVTAGTYTYTVTDANGCSETVSITVTEPTALAVSATATSIDCNGGTADVTVSATGGTPGYTGTGTFTVTAGTYTYTVTDANGCSETVSITVTEPAALALTATAGTILCNGGTADVVVSATGGTAPYTGDLGTFNVGAGTYTYTVTDANGCTATTSVTLTEPAVMQAFASCPGILCNGGTTDIGVTAFGGTPPYTGDIGVFNVGAGTYTYTITDANGCTASVTHTVTEPAALVVTATATSIGCNGGTADVTVTASGGTAPYTGDLGTFNVSAGTYTYTVTDANGCTTTETIVVSEPAPLVASATAASILCNGGTADVTVTATGGTAPYTGVGNYNVGAGTYDYIVTDANGCSDTVSITLTEPTAIQAFASCPAIDCAGGTADMAVFAFGGTPPYTGTGIFNVSAGTYTYTITDANGCTATVTHTVTEPAPLVLTATSTTIDCAGGTADVTVSATGGTPGYTGTGTFTGLSAGTYTYTVTDANGCTETVSITITEPSALSASATAGTILCNGGTADVTVTATGGTPSYTGTGTFSVTAGTHDFTVTDANGCSTTVSVTVTEPSALVASASATSILCNGGTADVTVTATGGTPPYTGTTTYTVGGGTYTYTVTDANGCTSDVTVTVVEPSALTATATVGTFDCTSLTADITVAAAGGTPPYTGTGSYTESEGTYTYTVTDANGCSVTVSATVATQNFVDIVCPGDQVYACESNQTCGGSQGTGATVSWDEPTASSFGTCSSGCGPVQCISGFQYIGEYGGSRYYRSTSANYSWQQANVAATNAGGHLATIGSAAENSFITSQLGCSYAWIGYTDQNVEGTFEWVTGENVTFENWAGSEPNNNGPVPNSCTYCGEADYTVISSGGSWYDRYECNLNQFIMEIPCGNPITITQTSGPANGSFVQGGTTQVVTYVATDNVTGATATCSFTVTVEECVPVYCESSGACTAYEWIDHVSLGTINNQSGNDGGYGDYTSMVTVASPGDVVNISLTPGFSGTPYTETWRIWVDWNYDGDFNDQGEFIGQGAGSSTLTGSLTVPSYATLNKNLRVRISMRWDCYAGPCSYFQYGEVEDYTIYIQDNGGINGMATVIGEGGKDFKQAGAPNSSMKAFDEGAEDVEMEGGIGLEVKDIYPNPVLATNGTFNLDVRSGSRSDVTVRIVDLSGKVMMTEYMLLEVGANKRTMDVTGFARGSYLIEVVSGDLKETTQLIVQ